MACGSGLYGLAVAGSHPGSRLTLLDWTNVLELARGNVARSGLEDRTTYIKGDAFETDLGGPYDLIVTHFFVDCLTQRELDALAIRIRPHLTPNALWLISDFCIPTGRLRLKFRKPTSRR